MNGRRWTKGDVWEMLDLAQQVDQITAACRLGRSVYAVQQKMAGLGAKWRERATSVEALARELGCSGSTVKTAAADLGIPSCGTGHGRRYSLDSVDADRLRKHLARKLVRHAQQRRAGRARHARDG